MTDFTEIGMRIKGLREACDVTPEELAQELGVTAAKYLAWEATGADVPVSAVYHIANRFGVDLIELLTGDYARLDTFEVVRAHEGLTVERYPGYHFADLAFRFRDKVMQPFLVTLEPGDEPAPLVKHPGQEFNLVLEGTVTVSFDDRELVLEAGDSIYFDPSHLHGQRRSGESRAVFVTVIAE
jgi:quercetin dioxygenase-like cupin family protein/DNA-binding XRE family transcriptional regulator